MREKIDSGRFSVRPYESGDVVLLPAGELLEGYADRLSTEHTEKTVLMLDGEFVGYADFKTVSRGRYCRIGYFIVIPEFRCSGVGARLLEEMERVARDKYGAVEIVASSSNHNKVGIDFFSNRGYRPYNIEKRPTHLTISLKKKL